MARAKTSGRRSHEAQKRRAGIRSFNRAGNRACDRLARAVVLAVAAHEERRLAADLHVALVQGRALRDRVRLAERDADIARMIGDADVATYLRTHGRRTMDAREEAMLAREIRRDLAAEARAPRAVAVVMRAPRGTTAQRTPRHVLPVSYPAAAYSPAFHRSL